MRIFRPVSGVKLDRMHAVHSAAPLLFSVVLVALVLLAVLTGVLVLAVRAGWLAGWVLWAVRVFPWLSAANRARRIHRRQMCLACGAGGRKDIRFDPTEKMVLVQCPVCLATWGYNPVVNAGKWVAPNVEK
jgi:hypothetical protein